MIINLANERQKRAYPISKRLHHNTRAILMQEAFDEQEARGQPLNYDLACQRVNEWIDAIWK
jgi:hypothetical protein